MALRPLFNIMKPKAEKPLRLLCSVLLTVIQYSQQMQ